MSNPRSVKSTETPEYLLTIKEAARAFQLEILDIQFGIDTFCIATYRTTSSKTVLVRSREIEAYIASGLGGV